MMVSAASAAGMPVPRITSSMPGATGPGRGWLRSILNSLPPAAAWFAGSGAGRDRSPDRRHTARRLGRSATSHGKFNRALAAAAPSPEKPDRRFPPPPPLRPRIDAMICCFPVSATNTSPAASTAMPRGMLQAAGAELTQAAGARSRRCTRAASCSVKKRCPRRRAPGHAALTDSGPAWNCARGYPPSESCLRRMSAI